MLNHKSFVDYYTGYPLENGEKYVIAKTWYAYEMKRPGCVWTHSIVLHSYSSMLKPHRHPQSPRLGHSLPNIHKISFCINVATMVEEVRIGIQDKSAIKRLEEDHGISALKESEGAELLEEKPNNQSAVVELLQCVDHLVKHPLKIKFIISAWDLSHILSFYHIPNHEKLLPINPVLQIESASVDY